MGVSNEDFEKLLISLITGRIEFLLDIEDLAFEVRVVIDSIGHLFIGVTYGSRTSIA
jgi:hypothetical protein